MILERTVIHCKPGTVNQFVDSFKDTFSRIKEQDVIKSARVMTDLTGPFDTVVIESEIESIDAYFALLKSMFEEESQGPDSVIGSYVSGHRTFYTIEAIY